MLLAVFVSEFLGTMVLVLLGCGVVANWLLGKTKGNATGSFFMVNWGWGIAVFAGVYFAIKTGGHINPAVTLGVWAQSVVDPSFTEFMPGIPINAGTILIYISAQLTGAIFGAVLCWLTYKKHYDDPDTDPAMKLATLPTTPEIRNKKWNTVTEAIATFVLVGWVVVIRTLIPWDPESMTLVWVALGVALVVVGIGASLGGPTGYAINPARDLGPRIAHAILPIKGKGGSDWDYAWVPILGPLLGGLLAGFLLPPLMAIIVNAGIGL